MPAVAQDQGHNGRKVQESWAGLGSGDGPLSVRARPTSLKHDCNRRATSTGGECRVNVRAKSSMTLEPLPAQRA